MSQACTIQEIVEHLVGEEWTDSVDARVLSWPPDAYAIAATILRDSGGYLDVAHRWPGKRFKKGSWSEVMKSLGSQWLEMVVGNLPEVPDAETLKSQSPSDIGSQVLADESPSTPTCPQEICKYWQCIKDHKSHTLREIVATDPKDRPTELILALVAVVACSDEACFGVGALPAPQNPIDKGDLTTIGQKMMYAASRKLLKDMDKDLATTLCLCVRRDAALVLPKTRTPQTGMSIRCLTHNLALLRGGEVRADWYIANRPASQESSESSHCLTLLLVPWPTDVYPTQFQAVPRTETGPYHTSSLVRLFQFVHNKDHSPDKITIDTLFRSAVQQIGRIDGVIFPELSLTEQEFNSVSEDVRLKIASVRNPVRAASFVLGGVYHGGSHDSFGLNKIIVDLTINDDRQTLKREQHKHHRWHLNHGQIRQYGLGAQLDPRMLWVEHIQLLDRRVEFFNLSNQLSMCALVCEDLAQSDPIAETIRNVGPNLLICLLADGPQLTSRWPSRYATTLADDPGCSVLTLTSRGMAKLSQPRNGEPPRHDVVGLWKEPGGAAQELRLEQNSQAIALSLSIATERQWTADHRHDRKTTRSITLSGIRQIHAE